MIDIHWEDAKEPLNIQDIQKIGKALGVRFPDDFIQVVQLAHGGFPDKTDFYYVDTKGHKKTACLAQMVSFDLRDKANILSIKEWLGDQLPGEVIPFGDDGGGDFICLDYRTAKDNPKISYWSHEKPKDSSTSIVSENFTEFLMKLREPND